MEKDSIAINYKTYSLQEVLQSIQSVLLKTYANRSYWVRCELSRISLHAQSGHCYLELIDKNDTAIVAQLRGIIWADRYSIIIDKFKSVTNTPLANGMKVLLQCSVNFHPLHGLSLTVSDIEPSFTLGEMARMKNESISKLKSEGLFDLNRRLRLPLLPERIALISVETSRGYQDFISTLASHPRKYAIKYQLFDAILQGENAVPSMIRAFSQITSDKHGFDAIFIIRGGAGDAGLACYDEYSLSALIARTPIPVITGIGHATNETVAEMVAYKNCITPTAAANFLLEKYDTQFNFLSEQSMMINEIVKNFFTEEKQNIISQTERFCLIVGNQMDRQGFMLKNLLAGLPAYLGRYFSIMQQNIKQSVQTIFNVKRLGNHALFLSQLQRIESDIKRSLEEFFTGNKEKINEQVVELSGVILLLKRNIEQLEHLSEKTSLLDPVNTLKRGYSITRHNGKVLTVASEVSSGVQIETELANGKIISITEKKK